MSKAKPRTKPADSRLAMLAESLAHELYLRHGLDAPPLVERTGWNFDGRAGLLIPLDDAETFMNHLRKERRDDG